MFPSKKWEVGDLVQIGRVRWLIRAIAGRQVVLTAGNTGAAAVWWYTTLTNLPRKA